MNGLNEVQLPAVRTPSLWTVARLQFELIDMNGRFPTIVLLMAMAAAAGLAFSQKVPEMYLPFAPLLLATLAWPAVVWQDETPSRRTYHRSMPVDLLTHDLIKIGIGAVYLMTALAMVLTVILTSVQLSGSEYLQGLHLMSMNVLINYFTATLTVYLLASIVPLLVDKPLHWLTGLAAGFASMGVLNSIYKNNPINILYDLFISSPVGLGTALYGGYINEPWNRHLRFPLAPGGPTSSDALLWFLVALVWLALALAAVCFASKLSNRNRPTIKGTLNRLAPLTAWRNFEINSEVEGPTV